MNLLPKLATLLGRIVLAFRIAFLGYRPPQRMPALATPVPTPPPALHPPPLPTEAPAPNAFSAAPPSDAFTEILGTQEVEFQLRQLLRTAQETVWLVSPYVTLDKLAWLNREIKEALARKVEVVLVVRDEPKIVEDAHRSAAPLIELGLRILAVEYLHAKIYWSDQMVLLTSLNLLAYSMNNSIEVGVAARAGDVHSKVLTFIEREIQPYTRDVIDAKKPRPRPRRAPAAPPARRRRSRRDGRCIRCADEIPLDPSRPYCDSDYATWARYSNENFEDNYCHDCGDDYPATMRKPLCPDCYADAR